MRQKTGVAIETFYSKCNSDQQSPRGIGTPTWLATTYEAVWGQTQTTLVTHPQELARPVARGTSRRG